MRNISIFIALEILVLGCCSATASVKGDSSTGAQVTITILYDNVSYDTMFTPSNGFSCFIAGLEKTILFDAGGEPDILLYNMKQANIDPNRIQYLVISHVHFDHIGGLKGATAWKNMETAFLPVKLPYPLARNERVNSLPVGLFPHVFLTGVMHPVPANVIHGDEQSLIIDTPQGLVLITGCAHPGIVSILKRAKEIVNKDIYLVLGGFHLLNHTDEQIKTIVDSFKSMGVRYCGPTHCTGDKAKAAFREAYGDHYVEMGAGRKITLDKDGLLLGPDPHFSKHLDDQFPLTLNLPQSICHLGSEIFKSVLPRRANHRTLGVSPKN